MHNIKNVIHCIGDSHVCFFSGRNKQHPIWPQTHRNLIPIFKSYRLGPVLAYNLCKNGTRTQGREKLFSLLKEVPVGERIMMCFGEIDCRVHLPKRCIGTKMDIFTAVKECANRYFSVILELKEMNYEALVWHVIPSSKYDVTFGNYQTFGSCVERNNITKLFNKQLSDMAKASNMEIISIFDKLVDKEGITRDEYYYDSIHLSQEAMVLALDEIEKNIPEMNVNSSREILRKLEVVYRPSDTYRGIIRWGKSKLRNLLS